MWALRLDTIRAILGTALERNQSSVESQLADSSDFVLVPKAFHQPRLRVEYDRDDLDPSTASSSFPPSGDDRFV